MDILTIIFWIISLILIIFSFRKSKTKTLASMKKTRAMMKNLVGQIVMVILLIGLLITYVPPESIQRVLGSSNVVFGSLAAAVAGSITLIPAFVAFPLVASFVQIGASIIPGVAFLTTLTMVGVVTFPLERDAFGMKFTILRNLLSFGFAIVIAFGMGVLL